MPSSSRRPTDPLSTANVVFCCLKCMCYFGKQSLHKATEFAAKLLALQSAILFSLTSARAYFSVLLLDMPLCLCIAT